MQKRNTKSPKKTSSEKVSSAVTMEGGAVSAEVSAGESVSGKRAGGLIGYVQNLSPPKRNKKDTLNYSTFQLQMATGKVKEGLCFSSTKRRLLEEKQSTRTALKLMGYTSTATGERFVVNDMTLISTPNALEYSFQFSDELSSKKSQTKTLKEVAEQGLDMELVTVCVKVLTVEPVKIVGMDKLKLVNAVIADRSATVPLEIWENQVDAISCSGMYRMENLRVRNRNGVKMLGTTKETSVDQIANDDLQKLCCNSKTVDVAPTRSVKVANINYIERLEEFKKCCNCKKKIIQASTTNSGIIRCDKCQCVMKSENCENGVWAKLVVIVDGENVQLILFEEVLKSFCKGKLPSVDQLHEKLLLESNLEITYNRNSKIVSSMSTYLA